MNRTDPGPRRRVLIFGPGLAVALGLSVFVLYQHFQERGEQRRSGGPIVQHIVAPSTPAPVAPGREPRLVLDHAAELKLTAAQREELEGIVRAYEREVQPLKQKLDQAAADFEGHMAQQPTNRPTDLGSVQQAAAPVMGLSRRVAAVRSAYWDQATQVLQPSQQEKLESLLESAPGPAPPKPSPNGG